MKIEISELVASVLQRMIDEEIKKQGQLMQEERTIMLLNNEATRKEIIKQLEKLATDLEANGTPKYYH